MKEKVEELERILAEKVEKEEGWRQLEVGEVKPIYVGKLRESLKKLPSPAIVLAVQAKYFQRFGLALKITKFAKIVFEVEKKVIEPILSEPFLSFKADNFGPFTEEIYDNLFFLQNLDLVEIAKEEDVTEISITEKGVKVFNERVGKEIPREILKMIEIIIGEYGSLNHDELLRRVYSEYPEFAEKSLVRGRYR
jgi:uncharacterized protein YwgA